MSKSYGKILVLTCLMLLFIFCALPIWSKGQESQTSPSILQRLERLEKLIPPVGTIMAWHKSLFDEPLPEGWIKCDGQTIDGKVIPDLNGVKNGGKGYFLRGSTNSGVPQNDCVNPAGLSVDISHTHAASSVSGTVGGNDGTHTHTGLTSGTTINVNRDMGGNFTGNVNTGIPAFQNATYQNQLPLAGGNHTHNFTTSTCTAHGHSFSLTASGQTLGTTNKNINGGSNETRPINMSVVWIMRIK